MKGKKKKQVSKPRNPAVVLMLKRKSGEHGPTDQTKRRKKNSELSLKVRSGKLDEIL